MSLLLIPRPRMEPTGPPPWARAPDAGQPADWGPQPQAGSQ